jgi:hypothetical protein
MTIQAELFSRFREETFPLPRPAAAFVAGSETSRKAAASIAGRTRSMRAKVLEFFRLRKDYGGTDQETADFLGLPENSIRPRRIELVQAGLVIDSGKTRLTQSRRSAVVWIIAECVSRDISPAAPLPF